MKSKGRELQSKKLVRMKREYKKELRQRNFSRFASRNFLKKAKKEPLAPYPKKAMLMTRKAKW